MDVDSTNSYGATALHDAVKRGDLNVVQVLLQYGASRNITALRGVGIICERYLIIIIIIIIIIITIIIIINNLYSVVNSGGISYLIFHLNTTQRS